MQETDERLCSSGFFAHKPFLKKSDNEYICQVKVIDHKHFINSNHWEFCNFTCSNFEELSKHNELEHNWTSESPQCCKKCEVYMRTYCEFLAHSIYHMKELYTSNKFKDTFFCCEACDKMYHDVFNAFHSKKCQTFSPVTMNQKYFSYADLSKLDATADKKIEDLSQQFASLKVNSV